MLPQIRAKGFCWHSGINSVRTLTLTAVVLLRLTRLLEREGEEVREQQAVICCLALHAPVFDPAAAGKGCSIPPLALSKAATAPGCGSSLFLPLDFTGVLCCAWVWFSVPQTALVSPLGKHKKLLSRAWSCRNRACSVRLSRGGMYGDHEVSVAPGLDWTV